MAARIHDVARTSPPIGAPLRARCGRFLDRRTHPALGHRAPGTAAAGGDPPRQLLPRLGDDAGAVPAPTVRDRRTLHPADPGPHRPPGGPGIALDGRPGRLPPTVRPAGTRTPA